MNELANYLYELIGVTFCYKSCPECGLTYRYQEYEDGLHNFDDNHCFSLSFMVFLHAFVEVRICNDALIVYRDINYGKYS